MSPVLNAVVLLTVTTVLVALTVVLWRERTSSRDARVVLIVALLLGGWLVTATILATRTFFQPASSTGFPPVGIAFGATFLVLLTSVVISARLRRLLSRQVSLMRLHVWRIMGVVFLVLMLEGRLPVLFALPAGLGDVLIGATALWAARQVEEATSRRRAVLWNVLGLLDLLVAIGLGITTNPGPTNFFSVTPTSELLTRFPLVLVPVFLVPLALTLHIISIRQLLSAKWARSHSERRASARQLQLVEARTDGLKLTPPGGQR